MSFSTEELLLATKVWELCVHIRTDEWVRAWNDWKHEKGEDYDMIEAEEFRREWYKSRPYDGYVRLAYSRITGVAESIRRLQK